MPHRIIWSWYTGRCWVGCYIWYSEEGTGWGHSPPRPLLAETNVTVHPSTASVPITVLLCNGPLLCGFNVPTKGLTKNHYNSPSYSLSWHNINVWRILHITNCISEIKFTQVIFMVTVMVNQSTAVAIWQVLPDWKRPTGRPSHTWFSVIKADLGPLNFSLTTAWRKATTWDEGDILWT